LGSPQLIGLTGAIGGAAVAAGGLIFTRISSLGLWRSLGIAFALIAIGLWLFVGNSTYQFTLAGVIVTSIGCGMTLPAILTSIMARLSFEERGRGAGGWQTAFFLGNFVSPLAVLGLSKATGTLPSALLLLALAAAIGALLCSGLAMRERKSAS
jgi:MFS family permease